MFYLNKNDLEKYFNLYLTDIKIEFVGNNFFEKKENIKLNYIKKILNNIS